MEEHPRHPTFENTFRDQRDERPMNDQTNCRYCVISAGHLNQDGSTSGTDGEVVHHCEAPMLIDRPTVSDRIEPYVIFETKFERGCVALEPPDVDGDFDGCTLGGEVLSFNVADVIKVGRDCFR